MRKCLWMTAGIPVLLFLCAWSLSFSWEFSAAPVCDANVSGLIGDLLTGFDCEAQQHQLYENELLRREILERSGEETRHWLEDSTPVTHGLFLLYGPQSPICSALLFANRHALILHGRAPPVF